MALHFNVRRRERRAYRLGYLARYVNDAEAELPELPSAFRRRARRRVSRPEKKRNNAAFREGPRAPSGRLRTRAVAEGEEHTAAYGAQYWRLKAAKG